MIVVGIDPGLSGGVAAASWEAGGRVRLLDAIDVPTIGDQAKRRVAVGVLNGWIKRHDPTHAVIERAQAMPVKGRHGKEDEEVWQGQGASAAFIYGRAVGALEACVEGMLGQPPVVIETTAWKKAHALLGLKVKKSEIKEASRQRALRLFPDVGPRLFPRKGDHNRAEAALIAWFGIMLLREVQPRLAGT